MNDCYYTQIWMGFRWKNYVRLWPRLHQVPRIQPRSTAHLFLFFETLFRKQYSIHRKHGCSSSTCSEVQLSTANLEAENTNFLPKCHFAEKHYSAFEHMNIFNDSYSSFVPFGAVSCTKVHSVTGSKCKFAHFVQETATSDPKFGQLLF